MSKYLEQVLAVIIQTPLSDDGIGRYDTDVITAIHRNFYVDDFITSVAEEQTAIRFVLQISRLLSEGGFRLHKWLSTSRAVIKTVPESERAGSIKQITIDSELPLDRALGIKLKRATRQFQL